MDTALQNVFDKYESFQLEVIKEDSEKPYEWDYLIFGINKASKEKCLMLAVDKLNLDAKEIAEMLVRRLNNHDWPFVTTTV